MNAVDELNLLLGIGPPKPKLPITLQRSGYAPIRTLGKGAFGSAYLVYHSGRNKYYVAKHINMMTMSHKQRKEAHNEIAIIQRFEHPNIVKYVEFFEEHPQLYIMMEYADGGDLFSHLKKLKATGGRMTETQVVSLLAQTAMAIKHMHDRKILHRDLKTANVFLTKAHVVKVGDFGISTVLQNTMAMAKTMCGTPCYFSPELCHGRPYNNKSDVWALGVIAYELASNRLPFESTNMKKLMEEITTASPPRIPRDFSEQLWLLISAMLAKDPARRPDINAVLRSPALTQQLPGIVENMASLVPSPSPSSRHANAGRASARMLGGAHAGNDDEDREERRLHELRERLRGARLETQLEDPKQRHAHAPGSSLPPPPPPPPPPPRGVVAAARQRHGVEHPAPPAAPVLEERPHAAPPLAGYNSNNNNDGITRASSRQMGGSAPRSLSPQLAERPLPVPLPSHADRLGKPQPEPPTFHVTPSGAVVEVPAEAPQMTAASESPSVPRYDPILLRQRDDSYYGSYHAPLSSGAPSAPPQQQAGRDEQRKRASSPHSSEVVDESPQAVDTDGCAGSGERSDGDGDGDDDDTIALATVIRNMVRVSGASGLADRFGFSSNAARGGLGASIDDTVRTDAEGESAIPAEPASGPDDAGGEEFVDACGFSLDVARLQHVEVLQAAREVKRESLSLGDEVGQSESGDGAGGPCEMTDVAFSGACLCGAAAFTGWISSIFGTFTSTDAMHRRFSGAAAVELLHLPDADFFADLFIPPASPSALGHYKFPGTQRTTTFFCNRCGASLAMHLDGMEGCVILRSALDDASLEILGQRLSAL